MPWLAAAALALAIAVLAGFGERRRKRRADLDRVGLVDWSTVQMIALVAVAILSIIAFHE